jgi:hypothetical protein
VLQIWWTRTSTWDIVIYLEFEENDAIDDKRDVFIRQANNILCNFSKLSPRVSQQLFHYYCNSLFSGDSIITTLTIYETCSVAPGEYDSMVTTSHGTKRIIATTFHLLVLHDDICHRKLSFIKRCTSHQLDFFTASRLMESYRHAKYPPLDAL